MPVLVLANPKGSVGRTTLAKEIALGLEARHPGQVALADLCQPPDLQQWRSQRTGSAPPLLENRSLEEVEHWPTRVARAVGEWLVVDAPSNDLDTSLAAIGAADFVLIPATDWHIDVTCAIETAQACAQRNKPFAFVLNKIDGSQPLRAAAFLTSHGPVLAAPVRYSRWFQVDNPGGSAFDKGANKKVRADMTQVVQCVLDQFSRLIECFEPRALGATDVP